MLFYFITYTVLFVFLWSIRYQKIIAGLKLWTQEGEDCGAWTPTTGTEREMRVLKLTFATFFFSFVFFPLLLSLNILLFLKAFVTGFLSSVSSNKK
jgi:hypothetical protein